MAKNPEKGLLFEGDMRTVLKVILILYQNVINKRLLKGELNWLNTLCFISNIKQELRVKRYYMF